MSEMGETVVHEHTVGTVEVQGTEFDRFIAKVKADAWDECAASARGDMEAELVAANPYREEN